MDITRREAVKIAAAGVAALSSAIGLAELNHVSAACQPHAPPKTPKQLKGHKGRINAVVFSPDGKTLASAGDDGTAIIWDATTEKELVALRVHDVPAVNEPYRLKQVLSVAFSPDGKTLVSGAVDGSLKLWNPSTGKLRRNLAASDEWWWKWEHASVSCISFSPDGRKIAAAVAHYDLAGCHSAFTVPCSAIVWDMATGNALRTINRGGTTYNPQVAFMLPEGKTLAWTSKQKRGTVILDVMTGEERANLLTTNGSSTTCLAVSPNGKILASAELGYTTEPVEVPYYQIVLWDVASGRELAKLEPQTECISYLAFSQDGKLLAAAARDEVRVLDVDTWSNRASFAEFRFGPANSLVFSSNSRTLAVGYETGVVLLWDLSHGDKE